PSRDSPRDSANFSRTALPRHRSTRNLRRTSSLACSTSCSNGACSQRLRSIAADSPVNLRISSGTAFDPIGTISRRAHVAAGFTKARDHEIFYVVNQREATRTVCEIRMSQPCLDFVFSCFRVSGCDTSHVSLSGVQIVPIHDRVESQAERTLRLPSPERANRKQDDVTVADLLVDGSRAAGQRLTTGKRAGQQQLTGILRELHHDARA